MSRVALVGRVARRSHVDRVRRRASRSSWRRSRLIDVGHKLEPEGVRKIVDFMRAHESFASLEEAAQEIAKYLPQRKNVRPESLTRNLRQRTDGRWEWKHGMGRRFRDAPDAEHPADNLDTFLAGVDEAAGRLQCPVLVLRGDASDVLSQQGAEEVAALIPDARSRRSERRVTSRPGESARRSAWCPRSSTACAGSQMLRGFLHRLFGGATDDTGRAVPRPDEWIAVFRRLDHDALIIRDAFRDESIETTAETTSRSAAALGASTDPHAVISVRGTDLLSADRLLSTIPHLGQRMMRTDDPLTTTPKPSGRSTRHR